MGSGGQYTMRRGVDIPWIGWVNIPCEGGRYTMGRGRYTMDRGLIYHG